MQAAPPLRIAGPQVGRLSCKGVVDRLLEVVPNLREQGLPLRGVDTMLCEYVGRLPICRGV